MNVVVNINSAAQMLKARGLEPDGRIQRMFTARCAAEMDPYIPFQQGALKNNRVIAPDSVTYNSPHARFHYHGKVMVGIKSRSAYAKLGERKEVTPKDLRHHGAPKRGPFWDKRMWADKKTKIVGDVAIAAGGRPG